jgi:DNA polymerase-1
VYTVQSDEALVMQHATVLANERLDAKYEDGVDFKQVGFFHDEYTFEVKPEIAEDVKVILEESIGEAGEYFNLNLPQIGEGEIGLNWSEIH